MLTLDKLTYAGDKQNLSLVSREKNHQFIKADINNLSCLREIFLDFKPEIVVNFAAETHVDNSIEDPEIFIKTNVLGVQNLLYLSENIKVKKFIQISTDEVYGSTHKGEFTEQSPLAPNSPYSASKAAADLLCRSYKKTFQTNTMIIRCVNNFGTRQFPEKLIPFSIKKLLNKEKISLYGDGKNVREWIFVRDFALAVEFLMHQGKIGEIYNVGSGYRLSNLEIAQKILGIFSLPSDHIEFVTDRPGHDFRYALNCDRIRNLGWQAKFNFDVALKETVECFTN